MHDNIKELKAQFELEQQNYKGPFCCLEMDSILENSNQLYNVKYNPRLQEYYLESIEKPYIRTFEFCLWCGCQLPEALKEEQFNALGLDYPSLPVQRLKEKMTQINGNNEYFICCPDMNFVLNDSLFNIEYNISIIEYYLKSVRESYIRTFEFCPWCGYQFMSNLRHVLFDILEKEYGLNLRIPQHREEIPAEFETDEWWKKRGL